LTADLLSTSGKVLFEGHDITNLTPEARAHLGLARTFQVPLTFEGMSVLGERDDRRISADIASSGSRSPRPRGAGARRQ